MLGNELAELEVPIGTITLPKLPPPGRCLWPCGEVGQPGFSWCGLRVATRGRPYCRKHLAIARDPRAPRRR